jgi:hypothetical protein
MSQEENGVLDEQSVEKPSIFGMIMNPGEQFMRLRERPIFLVPFIIVTVLTIIGMWMMSQGIDFTELDENMPPVSGDELAFFETITKITFFVTGLFTPIISILISTVIYFIVAKIVKTDVGFKQLFSMSTFIYFISAIAIVINGLAMMLAGGGDENALFTSLNSVVGADGALGALFNMIEVFSIWAIILGALGLQIVAKFSKVLSWSVVIGLFVVGAIFSMVGAALTSMMGAF